MNPDILRNTDFQRQGNGVAIVTAKDGRIWWIGGMGKYIWVGTGENIVFPYDPVTDQWPKVTAYEVKSQGGGGFYRRTTYHTNIPPMHERRINHQAVVTSDGRIYVMGGYRLESKEDPDPVLKLHAVSNTMECYDPQTNSWEYKKPLSSVRMRFAAVVGPDDKIYVFGGAEGMANIDATPVLNTTEVYDPKTDSWTLRKPMPESREAHAAVLGSDGKIYVIGGASSVPTPPLNDVFIYDPVQDSWARGPKMKVPRAVLAAVATPDGKIYAIGGTDIGAYSGRKKLNFFLPKDHEFYTGKVQDTVEVLDISPSSGANP